MANLVTVKAGGDNDHACITFNPAYFVCAALDTQDCMIVVMFENGETGKLKFNSLEELYIAHEIMLSEVEQVMAPMHYYVAGEAPGAVY